MSDKMNVDRAVSTLRELADGTGNSDLRQHERDAIGWALSYALEHCPYTAQPQENNERSEDNPASPMQQLKAEIRSVVDDFVCIPPVRIAQEIDNLIYKLRELSAV